MFPKLDLEGIVFRLEDPFHGLQVDLATLKGSNLTGLADVQQYARRLMDVYQMVTDRIDRALEEAHQRGETVIYQYSRSPESGDIFGDPMEEYDPAAHKRLVADARLQVQNRLYDAKIEAREIKNRIAKRLQPELANDYVDVRAFVGYVIFKTPEGTYGVDLNEPGKGIREAVPVMIFGRGGYLLKKAVAPIPENK